MDKKQARTSLLSVIALLLAAAALLLAGYNHYLIQEAYKELTRLNDIIIQLADINVQIGNILQGLAAEVTNLWKAIQGILDILGNLA